MGLQRRHTWRSALPALCLLLVLGAAAAQAAGIPQDAIPLDHNGLPEWTPAVWSDFPVEIALSGRADLGALLARIPLPAPDREDLAPARGGRGLVWRPRVTAEQFDALTAAGYAPRRVRDLDREGREAAEAAWAARAVSAGKSAATFTFPLDVYPTDAEIGTILDDIVAAHPAISRKFQWGYSVDGRDLWGIVISDNVTQNEIEPELIISSSMHGDEPVGVAMTLDFADYLTSHYGEAGFEDVTDIVDNYEIHLMPLYNPDGNANDTRYNANNVDLNRNFPEPAGPDPTQEIENQNYMSYANGQHFVLNINYHGGALVVNYPWDYTYTRAPDNDALIDMSLEYSTYNSPMYNGAFDQGITDGADWYVVTGSLQDWAYDRTGDFAVTIELGNTKWPAGSTLPGYWDDNRESLMHWVRTSRYGVNGVVTDAETGLPLDATITVAGIAKTVATDPQHGDYYKVLTTGTYDVTYSATGYQDHVETGVGVTWGAPTVIDVQLSPLANGDLSGHVEEAGGAPIAALVECYSLPSLALANSVYADAGGDYTIPDLYYGDYRLVVSAANHTTETQDVTVDAPTVTAPTVTLGITVDVTPFASDFEDGTADGWSVTGSWGPVAGGADGTSWAMTDSPTGNYSDNSTTTCAMSTDVDLTVLDSGSLTYWAKWNIESNWDGVQLQVSTDGGGSWTPVATAHTQPGSGQGVQTSGQPWYEGSQSTWVLETIDLAPWLAETQVRFRFVLMSDTSINKDGFYFDEFTISGQGEPITAAGDAPRPTTALAGARPNPFNPQTTLAYSLARPGRATLAVFDLAGRRVRTLVSGNQDAGPHTVVWDGRDADGARVPSGVYFARLAADDLRLVRKLMLVK